jgi:formate dehydrogenase major subunit
MTVKLTINDQEIEVPEGTTVLQAAQQTGIEIPTLCDHPNLTPYGGCRLCVVEVKGARTLQPSCTLPVNSGMVVHTETEKVREAREFVLTLLFSERNHFCMYCQTSGGDCELQNAAYGEGMTHWPLQPNWSPYPVDASHPNYVLDHNRCILCRRCVRACGELVGNFTWGVQERGAETILVADLGVPVGESSCVSCGTCVQVCPTGALIDRVSAYQGRETDVEHIKSTCTGCSVGCGIEMVVRDNRLVRIEGDWEAPVNEGLLCEMGRFTPMKEERERVLTPLVRKDGQLKASTWAEALTVLSAKLKPLAGQNGHGVAALASTRLPSEALSHFEQLFARKMGSQMVTSIEEGATTALPGNAAQQAGHPIESNLEALKSADCVIAVGVDLAASHQVAGFFVKRAIPNGTKLVVIDPFENGLNARADFALQPKTGTDYTLLMGLMAGLGKEAPVDVSQFSAAAVSEATGIAAETITAVSQMLAAAKKPVFVYGKGITASNSGDSLTALLNLTKMVDNASLLSVKGEANSLAAYLYNLDKPFELNGQKAVYLALGDDYPSKRLLQRLENAPFMAVQASYVSEATAMADVVLPAEMWAEQEGHFLNLEGRLQTIQRGLTAPAEVRSNVEILESLAAQLDFSLNNDWEGQLKQRVSPNPIME